ncbi:hypothetical protein VC83_01164 [Pseudogymnoascus destructans]|uniref:Pyrroloquinoline quinone-dependent pyranose dehydrogenase beta-propeller domain-containing protein n=1 Tax=Pseudogymnoascus destructans TaxID=655981 RepID=A0A177AME3_9PEZI|nr:uncharacterized protein VC83_01164 [Pseudogymnoascus destructans]OAF62662.1 hypothetical protein VC83_01164 [Pseudogymnoascus destructans]
MNNAGHSTRTILLSKKESGWLIISRRSAGNIDPLAEDKSSGHSHLKAFNIANLTASSPPYDFTADGRLLGWGMRNAVGVGRNQPLEASSPWRTLRTMSPEVEQTSTPPTRVRR